jgi:hypothetical protein
MPFQEAANAIAVFPEASAELRYPFRRPEVVAMSPRSWERASAWLRGRADRHIELREERLEGRGEGGGERFRAQQRFERKGFAVAHGLALFGYALSAAPKPRHGPRIPSPRRRENTRSGTRASASYGMRFRIIHGDDMQIHYGA